MVAPSVGAGLNVNKPPGVAKGWSTNAPSQVTVTVKDESSMSNTVTFCIDDSGQAPPVVYSTK
ncbi:hypothetical protein [Winogradskyella sp.]|uniref:hypothetical protein n=1 Tax=Winogradskyella sp. TaxID=1883156 RepID=UPI003F6A36CB